MSVGAGEVVLRGSGQSLTAQCPAGGRLKVHSENDNAKDPGRLSIAAE
jgi:hypothetical protein